ncbi:MAG: hypothetical protein NZM09_05725 [Ignavibacterium sp.]|nr:hypothetical protein [Ignavibacterium sp.]MDW8375177.1 hypothetical protein [Ignavibacteriales bacterium]
MIAEKIKGTELSLGSKIPEISDFINRVFNRLKNSKFSFEYVENDSKQLYKLFRETLQRFWNY